MEVETEEKPEEKKIETPKPEKKEKPPKSQEDGTRSLGEELLRELQEVKTKIGMNTTPAPEAKKSKEPEFVQVGFFRIRKDRK